MRGKTNLNTVERILLFALAIGVYAILGTLWWHSHSYAYAGHDHSYAEEKHGHYFGHDHNYAEEEHDHSYAETWHGHSYAEEGHNHYFSYAEEGHNHTGYDIHSLSDEIASVVEDCRVSHSQLFGDSIDC